MIKETTHNMQLDVLSRNLLGRNKTNKAYLEIEKKIEASWYTLTMLAVLCALCISLGLKPIFNNIINTKELISPFGHQTYFLTLKNTVEFLLTYIPYFVCLTIASSYFFLPNINRHQIYNIFAIANETISKRLFEGYSFTTALEFGSNTITLRNKQKTVYDGKKVLTKEALHLASQDTARGINYVEIAQKMPEVYSDFYVYYIDQSMKEGRIPEALGVIAEELKETSLVKIRYFYYNTLIIIGISGFSYLLCIGTFFAFLETIIYSLY